MQDTEPSGDVVFMGSASVGKTALIHRILRIQESSSQFNARLRPTVEDSYVRYFVAGDQWARLRIIDTAGSYTFPAMERLWIRRASAFILVGARDNADSLSNIRAIVQHIKDERKDEFDKISLVVVINKCDLHREDWQVTNANVELALRELHLPMDSVVYASAVLNIGTMPILHKLWEQNENLGEFGIAFQSISSTTPTDIVLATRRRSSALETLFGAGVVGAGTSQSSTGAGRRVSVQPLSPALTERRTFGSFSGGQMPSHFNSQRRTSIIDKIARLSMSGTSRQEKKAKEDTNGSAVIEIECCIS